MKRLPVRVVDVLKGDLRAHLHARPQPQGVEHEIRMLLDVVERALDSLDAEVVEDSGLAYVDQKHQRKIRGQHPKTTELLRALSRDALETLCLELATDLTDLDEPEMIRRPSDDAALAEDLLISVLS